MDDLTPGARFLATLSPAARAAVRKEGQAVLDGTWVTSQYWGGWKDGVVDIAPIGDMVPEAYWEIVARVYVFIAKLEGI